MLQPRKPPVQTQTSAPHQEIRRQVQQEARQRAIDCGYVRLALVMAGRAKPLTS